jgi:transcription antitermination factor NusG
MMLDNAQIMCNPPHTTDAAATIRSRAPCDSNPTIRQEFKFGHGGARPGAGRPHKTIVAAALSEPLTAWCVYQTWPQAERLAASEITHLGYRAYAPQIAVRRQDPVVRSMSHTSLTARFPGYGFVQLSSGEPWLPILDAKGVSRLLRDPCGKLARLPAGEIERHMLDDERLCNLKRQTLPSLAPATRVNILAGALESAIATVVECDGIATTVEVQIFGRLMAVRLDRAAVEVA